MLGHWSHALGLYLKAVFFLCQHIRVSGNIEVSHRAKYHTYAVLQDLTLHHSIRYVGSWGTGVQTDFLLIRRLFVQSPTVTVFYRPQYPLALNPSALSPVCYCMFFIVQCHWWAEDVYEWIRSLSWSVELERSRWSNSLKRCYANSIYIYYS